ncbi:MAG: HAMP domain-containing protein [Sulfurihydrogenibium sp.]|nr:MAG: HAMP domain-containing protein [Sulfurihydrogenibium sp.]
MEKKKSVLDKIFIIVLGGSSVGAILVGVLVYVMLVMSGVKDALIKSVISIVIAQVLFLFPVFMIRKLIEDNIVKKLRIVTDAMHEISMGNLDFEIHVEKTGDEIEELADSFERMRISMKAIVEKLEKGEL